MDHIDTKSALKSKGVWGAVIAMAAPFLPTLLKAIGVDETVTPDDVVNAASVGMALVGGALALIGRLFAKKRIA